MTKSEKKLSLNKLSYIAVNEGVFLPFIALVVYLIDRVSLNYWIRKWIRKKWPVILPDNTRKVPAWISETYVLVSIAFSFFSLSSAVSLPVVSWWISVVCVIWPIYRLVEMGGFVVGWVLVHKSPLHSIRRSLIGFLLNIMEICVLLTTLNIVTSKVSNVNKWVEVIKISVDFATFTPVQFYENGLWTATEFVRFIYGFFIMLCIIASLAGSIVRRTVQDVRREEQEVVSWSSQSSNKSDCPINK